MQEEKALHRRIRGRSWTVVIVALLISVMASARGAAMHDAPVWVRGAGGASFPLDQLHVVSVRRGSPLVGIFSTFSREYSLPDLVASCTRAGYYSPVHSLWMGWSFLHHPLYREDRVRVSYSRRLAREILRVAVRPAACFRGVEGYERTCAYGLACAAFFSYPSMPCVSIETGYSSGDHKRVRLKTGLSIERGPLSAVVNRTMRGMRRGDTCLGFRLEAYGDSGFFAGYRTVTGEAALGVLFRVGRLLIGFSWSYHPNLGKTVSFGVGRLWWRQDVSSL